MDHIGKTALLQSLQTNMIKVDSTNAIILTPIKTGVSIPHGDLGFDRVFSELQFISDSRQQNINMNSVKLQRLYKTLYSLKYKYVFLIDSDVVVTKEDLIKLSEGWNGEGTTACIDTKHRNDGHIYCACAFLLGEDYLKVDYLANGNTCQCRKLPNPYFVEGLRGYEVEYNRY